jgi:hypothetical protein
MKLNNFQFIMTGHAFMDSLQGARFHKRSGSCQLKGTLLHYRSYLRYPRQHNTTFSKWRSLYMSCFDTRLTSSGPVFCYNRVNSHVSQMFPVVYIYIYITTLCTVIYTTGHNKILQNVLHYYECFSQMTGFLNYVHPPELYKQTNSVALSPRANYTD